MDLVRERRTKQGADVQLVSFLLNPETEYRTTEAQQQDVFRLLRQYGGAAAAADPDQTLRRQYTQFRAKEGPFNRTCSAWEMAHDPTQFWIEMKPLAPELSALALRLFCAPANSVPSERSFSIRNLVQDKRRSCLSPITADKLSFMHVNRRVLNRNSGQARAWFALSEEELVALEDEVLDAAPEAPY
jgi:hypothetical protein